MTQTATTNETEWRRRAPSSLPLARQSSLSAWRSHGAEQARLTGAACRCSTRVATTCPRQQSSIHDVDDDDDKPQNSGPIAGISWRSTRAGCTSFRRRRAPAASGSAERSRESFPFRGARLMQPSVLFCVLLVTCLLVLQSAVLEARSIDDSAPPNGRIDTNKLNSNNNPNIQLPQQQHQHQALPITTTTHRPISVDALTDLIERVTSAFVAATSTTGTTTEQSIPASGEQEKPTTTTSQSSSKKEFQPATTQAPETTTTTTTADEDEQDGSAGAWDDDNDAENCQGLSSGPSAPGKGPSDNERLVNLQACLQKKVKQQLLSQARTSMEMFDKLSLSGACSASLMNLMSSLGELKGFAFKFLDASAKIPSGMMSGLLSDFGDFEQCLSIRSNPRIEPWQELDEGGYSGKYCLVNIRMRYKVRLGPNSTAPDGIYPDGVLWDELVRHYWTSNSTKGFQVAVCVPSKCDQDDLIQMLNLFSSSYHVQGELGACQDSNDLRRQQEPDQVQLVIIYVFLSILALNLVGTYLDRYLTNSVELKQVKYSKDLRCLLIKLLVCFSIRRNWRIFLHSRGSQSMGGPIDNLDGMSPMTTHGRHHNKCRSSVSVSTDTDEPATGCDTTGESTTSGSSNSFLSSSPGASSSEMRKHYDRLEFIDAEPNPFKPLTIKILNDKDGNCKSNFEDYQTASSSSRGSAQAKTIQLGHLWGLKLLVIIWITVGHSFLYPSANNYQHYRSIINMNITRNSVWFATTNFILGIDMLLYMTGLMFVHKLAQVNGIGGGVSSPTGIQSPKLASAQAPIGLKIVRLISRKVLRFWPTYLSVIALAIVLPMVSNGPMWPEMVTRRLGETCRSNWWANLLMINNFLDASRVCLPSSWFISVIMQCFLIGSGIVALANRRSPRVAMTVASLLILVSSAASFWLAFKNKLNAPAIRMDESFVMELDENIFRMYTSTLNNLGPFLVGMLGGFILLQGHKSKSRPHDKQNDQQQYSDQSKSTTTVERLSRVMFELNLAFAMALVALMVLSSVFFTSYTPLWSAVYWSCHRIGWALVTGYLIHQCATGKWCLLRDLLSLSTFIPLGRLIFIAYLVHPMFIHMHSGLVRDGLHVSLYNMLNIYITRLVMSFALALVLHLFVELPFCSLEEALLKAWLGASRRRKHLTGRDSNGPQQTNSPKVANLDTNQTGERKAGEPLLAVATYLSSDRTAVRGTFDRQDTTETTLGD